ncbi:hypothetical protein Sjap_012131 [Stephania japonica]|uniref:Non-structural maintenance of chromosomes element 1 homolog n=1 Tax=Stephania japonica TaxID=461633 RepID=A0AAP0NXZ7_9MAGN
MPNLSWRHHALVQALLSRGPMSESKFHSLFHALTKKDPGSHKQLFNDCLLAINKELAYVQFELRACRNQYNGEVCYGVVNNVADEQAKLGTKYSVPQITFYKSVVEAIVNDVTGQGCISNINALYVQLESQLAIGSQSQGGPSTIPPAIRNFTMSQKEKTLEELVKDGWLCSTSDGNIGLGVRSFLDLRSWLRMNDVPTCDICNEAGVKAELCHKEGCMVRIHSYCLKKKFPRRAERVCPVCGSLWGIRATKREVVEEEENEELNESTQTQTQGQVQAASSLRCSSRKRLRS